MKKNLILVVASVLVLSGCASLLYGVVIRTSGNVSSVLAGGTLNMRASGRDIVWSVSSNSSGTGGVASGTFINQNGVLSVAVNETALVLFVTATSTRDGYSDTRQIRVVTVTGVVISPLNQTVVAGRTLQFRAQVTGNNNPDNAVTWRVSSNASGTGAVTQGTSISAAGLLTVAPNEALSTLFVIATSVVDPSRFTSAPVAVVVPTVTSVTVRPENQTVSTGSTQQFMAAVAGTFDPPSTVTWRVSSNISGTGAVTQGTRISASGLLTVAPNETLSTLFVIATSTFDTSRTGVVSVSVVIPTVTSITISPSNVTLTAGRTQQFSASVTGTNNPSSAVTWRVGSAVGGTGAVTQGTHINANGLLTVAPNETLSNLFVTATSVIDPTRAVSAHIVVIPSTVPPPAATEPPPAQQPPPTPTVTSIMVNPASLIAQTNRTIQFEAIVLGTNNPSTNVIWRVSSNAAGTGPVMMGTNINANGLLTIVANETARELYVFATSVENPAITGTAVVTVRSN